MSIWHTSPCGATPIIRVVSRYHLTKQCRVIESADSEYRPVPVASALAAHCISCLEVDRAQKTSSVGQLLFPRAPWVTARYHYYSKTRHTARYRCHQSILLNSHRNSPCLAPYARWRNAARGIFGQQVLALVSWTKFHLSIRH